MKNRKKQVIVLVAVTAKGMEKKIKALMGCFSGQLSMLSAQADEIRLDGDQPDVVLLTGQRLSQIEAAYAALILPDANALPKEVRCRRSIAILNSADRAVMVLAAARRLRALTCGLSCADTFTLSSLTSDSAVISLQRSLTAFDGSQIEPFELPATFSGWIDPFALLSCAALCCMLGEKNPLAGRPRWEIPMRCTPEGSLKTKK